MRVFSAVAVIVLLTGSAAHAQHLNLIPEMKSLTPEEKAAEAEKDKAYKESLKKIPDAKTSSDPWGTVRSVDTPKETSKETSKTAAKPKTKTGSTAN
jgi:hypothetical protein